MASSKTSVATEIKKVKVLQSPQQCEKCKKGKATGFCRECKKLVCDQCIEIHENWEDYSNHEIIVFPRENPPPPKVLHCTKHPDNVLNLFCESCQELICDTCATEQHHGQEHQHDQVDKVFPKHRDEIHTHLQPVRDRLEAVDRAIESLDTRKSNITDRQSDLKDQIHKRVRELCEILEVKGVELISQLDRVTTQKTKSLDAQHKELEQLRSQLTSCLENTERSLSTGTPVQILATKASTLQQIKERSAEIDPDKLHPHETADMLLVEDDAPRLSEACRTFAVVTTTNRYVTRDVPQNVTVNDPLEVTLELMDTNDADTVHTQDISCELVCCRSKAAVKCGVERVRKGEFRIRCKAEDRGRHKLTVTVREVPAVGSPYAVLARPVVHNLQRPLKIIGSLKEPWYITKDSRGRMIVTERDAHCVTIFTPEGEKVRSIGGEGSGKGQLKSPRGVTVDMEDHIYVVEYGNSRVQKFTPNGEHVTSTDSSLQLSTSYGITFNPRNGKLYVCDYGNHRILILNTNLAILNTIHGDRDGKRELQYPQDIAFDSDGNMYIGTTRAVHVFSAEAQHLREIGSTGNGPDVEGIAIDDDRLYVADRSNSRISIFTTTGQLLHSFGSNGTGPGQFKVPHVTIDEDGFILVCDRDNNRIQIF